MANTNRFAGAVADRWVSVSGLGLTIVDSVGAEELKLGWLKIAFSGGLGDERPESIRLGESVPKSPVDSNWRVGRKEADDLAGPCCEECEGCLDRPSIWSGSGDGIRARGPSSALCDGCELSELALARLNVGLV